MSSRVRARDEGREETTRFRIQAVAEMTGTPAATLRAWERRYGVPSPARTASAYRLYSADDIRLIHKMRELCDQGIAAAEAARLVKRMAVEVHRAAAEDPLGEAVRAVVDAVRAFDVRALERALERAMLLGSAQTIYGSVLAPAMRRIGDLWHGGVVSVAQEHMASELIGGAARDLLRLVTPTPSIAVALLACFADEDHAFPLYGVGLSVARWQVRAVILGQRTPPAAVGHAVAELRPLFVGLSATVAMPAYRARELVEGYASACGDTPWIVGGAQRGALTRLVADAGGVVGELEALRPLLTATLRG
ncbi:MAG: MerR family transcriptional regulator [Myxococcales bacterium]|nr:MerR family transcriptional regulator [Myxococcales bacterium]